MNPPYTIHYILCTTKSIRRFTVLCPICSGITSIEVDNTLYEAWRNGLLIQGAFQLMRREDRETLISGCHPHCYEALFTR